MTTEIILDWRFYLSLIIAGILGGFSQAIGKELLDRLKEHSSKLKNKLKGGKKK